MSQQAPQLSGYTTLHLGGPADRLTVARTADDLVRYVREADDAGLPLLVMGGGSNLVISDAGFPGTVVGVATAGVDVIRDHDQARVTVAAGENWDQLVEWAVAQKLAGIECLAGIPGLAGAVPIQNVGAYGQEIAATIETVRVFDRVNGNMATLTGAECGFGYRTSVFKTTPGPGPGAFGTPAPTGRFVVLDVSFVLRSDPMSVPVRYSELAAKLGIAIGDQAPLADVRHAVLHLRRGKGMVLDPSDPDTANAGSFFTNPVLSQAEFAKLVRLVSAGEPGATVPWFPAPDGLVKVPAAWLIERAGFGKGYPGCGAARISSKHSLALTNQGGASTGELIDLARRIVAGVRSSFDIILTNEPVLVGVRL